MKGKLSRYLARLKESNPKGVYQVYLNYYESYELDVTHDLTAEADKKVIGPFYFLTEGVNCVVVVLGGFFLIKYEMHQQHGVNEEYVELIQRSDKVGYRLREVPEHLKYVDGKLGQYASLDQKLGCVYGGNAENERYG